MHVIQAYLIHQSAGGILSVRLLAPLDIITFYELVLRVLGSAKNGVHFIFGGV